jgi:hypothetical protein
MSTCSYVMITVTGWVAFFLLQVLILREFPLTLAALALCALLYIRRESGELHLFAFGLLLALIIEVGLGLVARSQHWEHASLLGVPYWLPLIWGYGFVVIRRVGNLIVQHFG